MNLSTNKSFRNIKGAISAYQTSITDTLNRYKMNVGRATEESKQYKNESGYLAGKKVIYAETARAEIESARERFVSTVTGEINSLRDELKEHLLMSPSPAFLANARAYRDFDIIPSKLEAEALIKQGGGATIAYEIINALLEKTNLRVNAPDAATYETDISTLEKLTNDVMWSDISNHHELSAIYGGTQRMGQIHGVVWDSTALMIARQTFESNVKTLDTVEERWNSTVVPSLRTIELYEQAEDGKTAEQQLANDIKAVPDAATIEHSEGETVQQARRMGAARAAEDAQAAKVMSLYASR